MKAADKIATVIFRVLAGVLGAGLLWLILRSKFDFKDVDKLLIVGAFFGLLIGYSFGGDRWGGRLFTFFTHIPVPEEKRPKQENDSASPRPAQKKNPG